jgi:1,4-alpha-glucan branching enzyme
LKQDTIRLITLSEYLEEYPSHQVSTPSTSSWGHKGFHEVWLNQKNDWIYRHLHQGARTMERLARDHAEGDGLHRRALKQAARELLLAQASDWAFMIHHGAMQEYAEKRIKTHLQRLIQLTKCIEAGTIPEDWLSAVESQDNIFPWIDCRSFAKDGGLT